MSVGGDTTLVFMKSPQGDIDRITAQIADYVVQVSRVAPPAAVEPAEDLAEPPPLVRPLPACLVYRDAALRSLREAKESGVGVV